MSTQRKLNELLYLNLQLFDGEASLPKRVFVQLRDTTGTLTKPQFEIFHVGGGEFRETVATEAMPNIEMLSASYFVYENDGVTLDTTYAVGKDVYMRDFSAEIIDVNLDAKVSSVGGGSGASIAGIDLQAELEETTLSADISVEDTLEGEIVEESLKGELDEC